MSASPTNTATPQPGTMALLPCPACAHPCSPAAHACPQCGHPLAPQQQGGLSETIFGHILTQSSMKVGMCLTLLGLMKVVEGVNSVATFADELLGINAVLFIVSSGLTFRALKAPTPEMQRSRGRVADAVFTTGLVLLAAICGIIAVQIL